MDADWKGRPPTIVLGRPIGPSHAPFVVAALDCTKLPRIEHVIAAIDEAAASECDAVKLGALPLPWSARVFAHASGRGIELITTVTDERTISDLDWAGPSAFEIFFDWADLELVACAARTGRPLVLSVANASDMELAEVAELARAEGARGLALVQRVLGTGLGDLAGLARHGDVIGISERGEAAGVVRAAIDHGARWFERRVAPRRIAEELSAIVRECDHAWASLGNVQHRWTRN